MKRIRALLKRRDRMAPIQEDEAFSAA